jgi:DNA-binding NarL/FixJ family response regulator
MSEIVSGFNPEKAKRDSGEAIDKVIFALDENNKVINNNQFLLATYIARGMSMEQIADRLGAEVSVIKHKKDSLYRKLGFSAGILNSFDPQVMLSLALKKISDDRAAGTENKTFKIQ